jgi:hypothetical protein
MSTIEKGKYMHTPGPWFVGTGWIGAGEIREGRVIARVDNYPYGDSEANIRLLAAAPELLEALRSAIKVLRWAGGNEERVYDAAVAAIAKAEGRP